MKNCISLLFAWYHCQLLLLKEKLKSINNAISKSDINPNKDTIPNNSNNCINILIGDTIKNDI